MTPDMERPATAGDGPSERDLLSRRDHSEATAKSRRFQLSGRYPHVPGFKGDLDTGRIAGKAFATKARPIRVRALEVIERGPATAEQVGDRIGEHFMIIRARCSELRALGLIDDSGMRGDGALGGRGVVVWRATTPLERAAFAAARDGAR